MSFLNKFQAFIELKYVCCFRRMKQRVIWKWETGEMNDLPSNVLLSKWLPQNDVLAHPNLKVFITHGGQSSFQESLCYQKPIVSSPHFLQIINVSLYNVAVYILCIE